MKLRGKHYITPEADEALRKAADNELTGFPHKKRCPRCGCTLLINKRRDVWCSFIECTYGLDAPLKDLDGDPEAKP